MYSRSYEYIHTYYKSANKCEGWNSNCVDVQSYVCMCALCIFQCSQFIFLTGFNFRFSLLKNAIYLFCFTWHGNDGPMHVWMYVYIKVTLTHKQKLTYTNGCVCVQQVESERESECMETQWWAQHSCWNLAVNGGE